MAKNLYESDSKCALEWSNIHIILRDNHEKSTYI